MILKCVMQKNDFYNVDHEMIVREIRCHKNTNIYLSYFLYLELLL